MGDESAGVLDGGDDAVPLYLLQVWKEDQEHKSVCEW